MNRAVKKYGLSLFMFRRDIRLYDNTGLLRACGESGSVIPSFFFHEDLTDESSRKFRPNLMQFMLESLSELEGDLKSRGQRLYLFYGEDLYKEFEKVITGEKIEAVYVNEDYTPYSVKRDKRLSSICRKRGVDFISCFDLLLTRPGDVLTADGAPYRKFTPFYKKAGKKEIAKPVQATDHNFYRAEVKGSRPLGFISGALSCRNKFLAQRGCRSSAVRTLRGIENFRSYKEQRDFPSAPGTTQLSAHLKFGTVSVREVYWAVRDRLGADHAMISQLFWRDFYAAVAYFFPHVFQRSFNDKYENIRWENSEEKFCAWRDGKTGFPIVDAGMRQLNKTGWMHNRVRMIVASFLTKDLHVHWRWGERYFASRLVDYDSCSNNGGWQWAASTGADSQPYFRIFNPWRQQRKFDPDAAYIKKWVPELKKLSPAEIHGIYLRSEGSVVKGYPSPVVDHAAESRRSKEIYAGR